MRSGSILDEQGKMNNFAIEPEVYVDAVARTGFTEYAEKLNGRVAMIAFVTMLALEAVSGQGLVTLLRSL
jgi:Chlorophyll A-B binding protein